MSNILKPLDIGILNLHNRLVMPPMATAKAKDNGEVSEDILSYYDEKSKGGNISLIIIEHSYIAEQGKASKNQLSIADDKLVEELKKLSSTIQKTVQKPLCRSTMREVLQKEKLPAWIL